MAAKCHGCQKELSAGAPVLGVFAGRKPSYGSRTVIWSELYDPQLLLVYHSECMQKMWEETMNEKLPLAT